MDKSKSLKNTRTPRFINIKIIYSILFLGCLVFYYSSMFILGSLFLASFLILFFTMKLSAKSLELTSNSSNLLPETKSLQKQLFEIQFLENIEKHGEKLYHQYEELIAKYESYLKLLGLKFNANEITFQRYHAAVESIYLALMDNFKKMANSYVFLSATPIKQLKSKLLLNPPAENIIEIKNKISIYEERLSKTIELYSLNDKALTEIDKLAFALNEIKSSQTPSEQDLKEMMSQLQELADRAKKYNL